MSSDISSLTLRLAQLSRELDEAQKELEAAGQEVARATHAHDLARAQATVTATGSSADLRRAQAIAAVEKEHLALLLAEAGREAARSRLRVLTSKVDVGRSLLASLRTEAELANAGGTP